MTANVESYDSVFHRVPSAFPAKFTEVPKPNYPISNSQSFTETPSKSHSAHLIHFASIPERFAIATEEEKKQAAILINEVSTPNVITASYWPFSAKKYQNIHNELLSNKMKPSSHTLKDLYQMLVDELKTVEYAINEINARDNMKQKKRAIIYISHPEIEDFLKNNSFEDKEKTKEHIYYTYQRVYTRIFIDKSFPMIHTLVFDSCLYDEEIISYGTLYNRHIEVTNRPIKLEAESDIVFKREKPEGIKTPNKELLKKIFPLLTDKNISESLKSIKNKITVILDQVLDDIKKLLILQNAYIYALSNIDIFTGQPLYTTELHSQHLGLLQNMFCSTLDKISYYSADLEESKRYKLQTIINNCPVLKATANSSLDKKIQEIRQRIDNPKSTIHQENPLLPLLTDGRKGNSNAAKKSLLTKDSVEKTLAPIICPLNCLRILEKASDYIIRNPQNPVTKVRPYVTPLFKNNLTEIQKQHFHFLHQTFIALLETTIVPNKENFTQEQKDELKTFLSTSKLMKRPAEVNFVGIPSSERNQAILNSLLGSAPQHQINIRKPSFNYQSP